MSRIVSKEVYSFEELSDDAKEKARDWYREVSDDGYWFGSVIDDAVQLGGMLGIDFDTRPVPLYGGGTRHEPKVYFRGFWSQGDGACFEGSYAYKPGAAKTIRKYAPEDVELHRIADALKEVQRRNFYRIRATCKQRGHYLHSGCMSVDVTAEGYDRSGYWSEFTLAHGISDDEDVIDLLRSFADWIYNRLEKEYEYQNSDEVVDDSIVVNEYEFTESGSRCFCL